MVIDRKRLDTYNFFKFVVSTIATVAALVNAALPGAPVLTFVLLVVASTSLSVLLLGEWLWGGKFPKALLLWLPLAVISMGVLFIAL